MRKKKEKRINFKLFQRQTTIENLFSKKKLKIKIDINYLYSSNNLFKNHLKKKIIIYLINILMKIIIIQ